METAKNQTIKLAKKEIEVPAFATVLNPSLAGRAKCAYFVWPFSPYAECVPSLQQAVNGEKRGTLFAFLTNHKDFYKIGRHDTPILRPHFETLKDESHELMGLMFAHWQETPFAGKPMAWAFSLAGESGIQPVGTSYGFAKEDGKFFIIDTVDEVRAYSHPRAQS